MAIDKVEGLLFSLAFKHVSVTQQLCPLLISSNYLFHFLQRPRLLQVWLLLHRLERRSTTVESKTSTGAPCSQISSTTASTSDAHLDASVALASLKSVPILDKQGDLLEIAGLRILSMFHSDLQYLKDPPPGFLYPAINIIGELDNIAAALTDGVYTNEYDVQIDLLKLAYSARDFHYAMRPDITQLFRFYRAEELMSVLTDGSSLPDVYMSTYVPALRAENVCHYRASPIVLINGIDVETFINGSAGQNN